MDQDRWESLMQRLGIDHNAGTYRALSEAYSQPHRYYHTKQHITECIALLDEFADLAENPDEVEIALWFHDAVYNPLAKGNEAKSARWATDFLEDKGVDQQVTSRVHQLIMATVHDAPATGTDCQLLVDIDLSILGSDPQTFQQFETNVRQEYRWVPGPLFNNARRKILQSFLDRKTIYATAAFRTTFEHTARINIQAAILALIN